MVTVAVKKGKVRARRNEKAQTISFDALVGVGLFVVAVIFFFYMVGRETVGDKAGNVEKESEKISEMLASPQNTSFSLVSGAKVDTLKLEELSNMDYEVIKAHLGMQADFCIYLEDEKGNVVPVSDKKLGIGNSKVNISGRACNQSLIPEP